MIIFLPMPSNDNKEPPSTLEIIITLIICIQGAYAVIKSTLELVL